MRGTSVRILALETTERIGAVAVLEDDTLLREVRLNAAERTASSLAPAITNLLAETGWKPGDLELVAANVGPGSFTGLRQGVTMAKTLAYTLGIEVLGVHTLESIGQMAPAEIDRLCVAIDAQRQQVFAGELLRNAQGELRLSGELEILDNEAWLCGLPPGTRISGPALKKLKDEIPAGLQPLDESYWLPTAGAVGQLAFRDFSAGRRQNVFALLPQYYRLSAAEEQRLAKQ
jgi:tRNA threonylcarbamoyladenosine biosynthesis protein TsaB